MKTAKIVNASKKEKELLDVIEFKTPIFIEYINGKSESYRIKSRYGARKNPFVVIEYDDDILPIPFYSEVDNAINQLINYLNGH